MVSRRASLSKFGFMRVWGAAGAPSHRDRFQPHYISRKPRLVDARAGHANLRHQPFRRAGDTGALATVRTTGARDYHPQLFSLRHQEYLRFMQAMEFLFDVPGRHYFPALSAMCFRTRHAISLYGLFATVHSSWRFGEG